ncbi:hypothetical protein SLEP1_g48784 [Rubroshorea leprosula]|uniref:Uncharacterized protein n=1 Tax=Rubroshorea leprosula TaxID=152421 RepID=A0AAV5LVK8_9ROSI|nr:hypothetical protein SLEP1_g48784 [Rubroshorea leprosula]
MARSYQKSPRIAPNRNGSRTGEEDQSRFRDFLGPTGVLKQGNREKSLSFAGFPAGKWVAVAGEFVGCRGLGERKSRARGSDGEGKKKE